MIRTGAGEDGAAIVTSRRSRPGGTAKDLAAKLRSIPKESRYAGAVAVLSCTSPLAIVCGLRSRRVDACTFTWWLETLRTVTLFDTTEPGRPIALSCALSTTSARPVGVGEPCASCQL